MALLGDLQALGNETILGVAQTASAGIQKTVQQIGTKPRTQNTAPQPDFTSAMAVSSEVASDFFKARFFGIPAPILVAGLIGLFIVVRRK